MKRLAYAMALIVIVATSLQRRRPAAQLSDSATTVAVSNDIPPAMNSAREGTTSRMTMIGTVMAGFASIAALVISILALGMQQQDRQERQEQQQAAFAARVTWWTEGTTGEGGMQVSIQNANGQPANALFLTRSKSFPRGGGDPTLPADTVGFVTGSLPPCSTNRFVEAQDKGTVGGIEVPSDIEFYALLFVDPANQVWRREANGTLTGPLSSSYLAAFRNGEESLYVWSISSRDVERTASQSCEVS
jgi:hypothetical protein